jgi:hypothetical protein
MKLNMKCRWCLRGFRRNRESGVLERCEACKGTSKMLRTVSYAGPVGKRMLAAERTTLSEIRRSNKNGYLGEGYHRGARERLEQKGKILFLPAIRSLRGGWMLAGWRKPLERSYYGEYGTKLWNPITRKLVK